jgi:hypothetical protein
MDVLDQNKSGPWPSIGPGKSRASSLRARASFSEDRADKKKENRFEEKPRRKRCSNKSNNLSKSGYQQVKRRAKPLEKPTEDF